MHNFSSKTVASLAADMIRFVTPCFVLFVLAYGLRFHSCLRTCTCILCCFQKQFGGMIAAMLMKIVSFDLSVALCSLSVTIIYDDLSPHVLTVDNPRNTDWTCLFLIQFVPVLFLS